MKLPVVFAGGAFLFAVSSTLAQAPTQNRPPTQSDVIWDLIGEQADGSPHQFVIFRDTHFGDRTGCTFNFRLSNPATANLSQIQNGVDVAKAFHTQSWAIVNWHWRNSTATVFAQDLPNLCSPDASVTTSGQAATITASYDGAPAETFSISPNGAILQLDSRLYYKKLFGDVFFPGSNQTTWPLVSFEHHFPFRRITDYSSLIVTFTATLRAAEVNKGRVRSANGLPPAGAAISYNPGVNASRLEFSLPLRWHPKYCSGSTLTSDQNCHTFYNKPLNFMTFFYDDRWDYWTKEPIALDPGTAGFGGIYIFREGCQWLIPGQPSVNPFRIVGKTTVARGDLLPKMKSAILYALAESEQAGSNSMPPRLVINGKRETDEEYVSNFSISDMGLGFENSGLANIAFEIRAFSLVGTKKF